jgi:uncharacterized protein YbaP (TraB family)
MFDNFKRTVAALAGVAAIGLGCASPAAAAPALWVVKDKDSTIYLFGTVHVLKPETQWRSPVLDQALARSAELWVETEADDQAVMQPLVMKYGMDAANPLSKKLTPERLAELDAVARTAGMTAAQLDPMRPWLAGLTLSVVPMLKAGYNPQSGVEAKLKAEVVAAGKPVRQLETPEQQIRFFADATPEVEMSFLDSAIDEAEESPAVLDEMVAAWAAGDVKAIERLMIDEMRGDYPGLYKTLLVDRNANWAEQIDTLLDGKGVSFIAVGAGHLAGDDSVQAMLAKRGIKVKRVKN